MRHGAGVRDFEGTKAAPADMLDVLAMASATEKVSGVLLDGGEQKLRLSGQIQWSASVQGNLGVPPLRS